MHLKVAAAAKEEAKEETSADSMAKNNSIAELRSELAEAERLLKLWREDAIGKDNRIAQLQSNLAEADLFASLRRTAASC